MDFKKKIEDLKKKTEDELLILLDQPKSDRELIAKVLLTAGKISNETLLHIIEEFKGEHEICLRSSVRLLAGENLSNGELRSFIANTDYLGLMEKAIVRLCGRPCTEEDLNVIIRFSPSNKEAAEERLADLKKRKKDIHIAEPEEEIFEQLI